jgi:membrane fusion protein, heavy metal efflux system
MNTDCRVLRNGSAPEHATGGIILAWLRRFASTTLVVAILVGVALWGRMTEWQFGWHRSKTMNDATTRPTELATISLGPTAIDASKLPVELQRPVSLVFTSAEAVENAGIDIAPVWTSPMTDALTVSGELSFDPSRVARLSARATGTVWKVLKPVGATVHAGEVVLLVDAAMIGKAKADLEQAIVRVRLRQKAADRLRKAGDVVPEQQRREADAALRNTEVALLGAEQSLMNLGLPVRSSDYAQRSLEEVVQKFRGLGVPPDVGFDAESGTANLLPVRTPVAGMILSADVVAGEVVDAGKALVTVVDPQRLRLTLHVPQSEARRLALGQVVKFLPDGQSDEVTAQASWIGTSADETTRTIPVRAEITNEQRTLRASTLGRGRIVLREEANAIVVPRDAIQVFHGTPVVFVRDPRFLKPDGVKQFHVRIVQTGATDGANTEVMAGLQPKEIVASKGASVLLHELIRLTQATGGSR